MGSQHNAGQFQRAKGISDSRENDRAEATSANYTGEQIICESTVMMDGTILYIYKETFFIFIFISFFYQMPTLEQYCLSLAEKNDRNMFLKIYM